MSGDIKSTLEFDMDLICEYYVGLKRQGPGSPEVTLKALGFIKGLDGESHIADIGCGTGGQTMVLAQHAPGRITGIDLFETFIDRFNQNVVELGLQDRVKGITGSMDHLPFLDEELDLIWSEGAIYNMGFERGLNEWKRFLKPGGCIAVSEISWLTEERPDEIHDFWVGKYTEIDTVASKVAVMQAAGYEVIASFVLPEECWIENYYVPQKAIVDDFLEAHPESEAAKALVAEQRKEAELYRRFKAYYGYGFYIGRKV
jgi:SAM-dependent methyltransferase